jgi:hypothetical protein
VRTLFFSLEQTGLYVGDEYGPVSTADAVGALVAGDTLAAAAPLAPLAAASSSVNATATLGSRSSSTPLTDYGYCGERITSIGD